MKCPTCAAETIQSGAMYWCPACGTLTDWPGLGCRAEVSMPKLVECCREAEKARGILFSRAMGLHWDDFIAPLIHP